MDYFNDSTFFPALTTEQLEAYQFMSQASTAANEVAYELTQPDFWSMAEPGPMADAQAAFMDTTTYESVAPAATYQNKTGDYSEPASSSQYCQELLIQPQFAEPSNPYGSSDASADSLAPEAPVTLPPSGSNPLGYWKAAESGPTSGMFYLNMDAIRNMRTGPTRSEPSHAERYQPYGTSRTHRVGHVNAEAGPSTLVPPHVPYVDSPIPQSTEGIFKRTANATNNKSVKEKKEAPKSKRTRVVRGQGKPRRYRIELVSTSRRLVAWAAKKKTCSEKTLTIGAALGIAVEEVQRTREVKNDQPCLKKAPLKEVEAPSREAKEERDRRGVDREWYRELSRYYSLEPRQTEWSRRELLAAVMKDLDPEQSEDPGASDEPPTSPPSLAATVSNT